MVIDTVANVDLKIGSHLVTARLGYTHHGVYAGAGKVVHYAGLSRSLRRGPVEEVTLEAFARGRPLWITRSPDARFAGREAIRRAYSRLGEDRYRLISNNCEHFCMWCLYGESRSEQIDVWKTWAIDVLDAGAKAIRQLSSLLTSIFGTRQLVDANSTATLQRFHTAVGDITETPSICAG